MLTVSVEWFLSAVAEETVVLIEGVIEAVKIFSLFMCTSVIPCVHCISLLFADIRGLRKSL